MPGAWFGQIEGYNVVAGQNVSGGIVTNNFHGDRPHAVPSLHGKNVVDCQEQQGAHKGEPHTRIGMAFRIRGVPLAWGASQLHSFLAQQEELQTQDGVDGPNLLSLADEVHGRSRVGTLTFQSPPPTAQKGRQWTIPLPSSLLTEEMAWPGRRPCLSLDADFHGITTLFSPPSEYHKIDIVAISGLGGHAFGSFKERGGEHMWLRDALPYDLTLDGHPTARVMVYGYDSSVCGSQSMQNLEDLAASFHSSLLALVETSTRPIIFVAHSLGGLIVKQVLISLARSEGQDDRALIQAVYGVLFFGVPHEGMDISSLIPIVGDQSNRFLLESIGNVNSQILEIQRRDFHTALGGKGDTEVFCFYETLQSCTAQQDGYGKWSMTGPPAFLVTKSSATRCRSWEDGPEHICPIFRSHSEMVKFGEHDAEYDKVIQRLTGLTRRAIQKDNSS